jgi:ubiquinone/menaquinone biosynthesis C-methylase UbiE
MTKKPHGAGKSSFDLLDPNILFSILDLKEDSLLADIGCGAGNYSVAISSYIGDSGKVYAIDLWEPGINQLKDRIAEKKVSNIYPILADVGDGIPLDDESLDYCFFATVFHDIVRSQESSVFLAEVNRVLKPDGKLFIIEFKKIDGHPGPGIEVRISEEELERMGSDASFVLNKNVDMQDFLYLSIFSK